MQMTGRKAMEWKWKSFLENWEGSMEWGKDLR